MKTSSWVVAALACTAGTAALARPWNGVEPGSTKREEVVKKFGEPSRAVMLAHEEVVAYFSKNAIKGTQQTQFRINPGTGVVERIDVFPAPVIDRETVESTYGPACKEGTRDAGPCYVRKMTDDFRTYFLYARLGLAVFFNEDGKSVQSFIFQPVKKPQASEPAEP